MPAAHAKHAGGASPSPRSTLPLAPANTPKPLHLTPPSPPAGDRAQRLRPARMTAGHASDANARFRPSMEDASTLTTLPCGGAFLGVYDGHGGSAAASLTASTLHDDFSDALQSGLPVACAFRSAYASVDAALRAARAYSVGTTAVTAYVPRGGGAVFVANAGDARAVLGAADGRATRLSTDHRASAPDEAARVRAAGGFVFAGRVNGVLAVSRALGDHAMKSVVVSQPDVNAVQLRAEHRFLVLACDGLWDVVQDEEAVSVVNALLDRPLTPSPAAIARALVRRALVAGSTDNVSVVVALFHAD